MTILNREAILAARRAKTKAVAVPEWGGDVLVRPLTAGEVQGMSEMFSGGDADIQKNIEAAFTLVAAGAINESGGPLFAGPDDLRGLDVGPVVRLAMAIAEISGIGEGDVAGK